jgi:hypothetical protein
VLEEDSSWRGLSASSQQVAEVQDKALRRAINFIYAGTSRGLPAMAWILLKFRRNNVVMRPGDAIYER